MMSGGGTGGHIFPAVAIANGLKARLGNRVNILFVGAKGRMEMEKVPKEGYPIKGLWISGFQRRLTIKNLLFPFKLVVSLIKAGGLIRKFKPVVVVGTGGYASGSLLYKAAQKNIPTLILEQNSYPGVTNKILAKKVSRICTAYEGMEKYFPAEKIVITGSPIRKEIRTLKPTREEALAFFKLDKDKTTLLVIGGSQGAQKINEAIAENLHTIVRENIQLIWQTGKPSYEMAQQAAQKVRYGDGENIKVFDFIYQMDKAYAASDLIVSRAGAIAIAEIIAVKKPAIFIPLPSAAEDHQTYNAKVLTARNAAILIPEEYAKEELPKTIETLTDNPYKLRELQSNLNQFEKKEATQLIVDEIVSMIKNQGVNMKQTL